MKTQVSEIEGGQECPDRRTIFASKGVRGAILAFYRESKLSENAAEIQFQGDFFLSLPQV